jgi:tetratricopeptide (TPR) repeat protein
MITDCNRAPMQNSGRNLILVFFMLAAVMFSIAGPTNSPPTDAGPDGTRLGNYKSFFECGVSFCTNQEWGNAISNFSEAVSVRPNDVPAHEWRGSAYFGYGDFKLAINDFTKVIQLEPANARAYASRGSCYRAMREFDRAIDDLTQSLRLGPTNASAYKIRAACFASKGETGKEIADWDQALRLDPKDATALAMRGYAFFLTNQFEKAVSDYQRAIDLEPANSLPHNYLAWLRATCPAKVMRNGQEAIEHATKACELTVWRRTEYIDTLAAAFAEAGDFEKATKYQKQALEKAARGETAHKAMEARLLLYERGQPFHDGQK